MIRKSGFWQGILLKLRGIRLLRKGLSEGKGRDQTFVHLVEWGNGSVRRYYLPYAQSSTNPWRSAKSIEHLEGRLGLIICKVCTNGPQCWKKRTTITRPAFHTWWMASGRSSGSVLSGNGHYCSRNVPFCSAKSISFQRHAALLVTNNAICLISGLVSGIWGGPCFST